MKQMTSMVGGRAFFPGKGGRRGFPMIGDDFGYPFGPPPGAGPPHDPKGPPFHDGGFPGGPYPQGQYRFHLSPLAVSLRTRFLKREVTRETNFCSAQ